MTVTHTSVKAIRPIIHQVVIGELYALEVGGAVDLGDCIEISSDPATLLSGVPTQNMIEVVRSLGGATRDLAHGFAAQRMLATAINRGLKMVCHGFTLAKNASSTNTLTPGRQWESAAAGGIAEATAWNFVRGRIYEPIPPLRLGIVFLY